MAFEAAVFHVDKRLHMPEHVLYTYSMAYYGSHGTWHLSKLSLANGMAPVMTFDQSILDQHFLCTNFEKYTGKANSLELFFSS